MAISYIGGKSQISKFIIPFIPNDIETYVESFSGMYWVFFNMDVSNYPNLKKIVYNDFNKLNVNLFRCLNNHSKLLNECLKVPVQKKNIFPTPPECKEFFNLSQSEIYDPNFIVPEYPDYELAAKYALVLTSVFSGANPSGGGYIDLKGKYHSKFTSFMNKLRNPKWQKMFEMINIVENMDFQDVIEKYDSPTTYVYNDPPYFIIGEGSYYSNLGFTREDHERLSKCLKNMKGKFSLSYYDFPQLHDWFPEGDYIWESREFSKAAAAKSGKKQPKAIEILIMK